MKEESVQEFFEKKMSEHGSTKKSAKLKTWEPMNKASLTSLLWTNLDINTTVIRDLFEHVK